MQGIDKNYTLFDTVNPLACLANSVIAAQSPFSSKSFGVSHEPPTHNTFGSAR